MSSIVNIGVPSVGRRSGIQSDANVMSTALSSLVDGDDVEGEVVDAMSKRKSS